MLTERSQQLINVAETKQLITTMLRLSPLLLVLGTVVTLVCAIVPVTTNENGIQPVVKRINKHVGGALYPRATETRDLRTLDGIWNFRRSPPNPLYGYLNGWQEQDLFKTGPVIPMPVPSSYNDVGEDASLRDHQGVVWYDRRFFVPRGWTDQRVWLRFSSVHYNAKVFVNGMEVASHEIGHLPFEAEITDFVSLNSSNLLTVVVDNLLTRNTIPQENGYDFFNYAGIHRTVYIYSTPQTYIEDIVTQTDIQGYTGLVTYNVTYKGGRNDVDCLIEIYDKNETKVGSLLSCVGVVDIANANLWWPYLMHPNPGYLYTFKVCLVGSDGDFLDTYSEKIGIRVVNWTTKSVYLNGKPLYLRGFGMHEDSDLRGKGWDPVLWVKNFNLIKWIGANAFRTSHYPYAEEIYQLADEQGIMIVGECPSVNAFLYTDELLRKHKQSLTEMIRRDRNHPSVIMWSVANEPQQCGSNKNCDYYYSQIVGHVKDLDRSRAVTFALADPNDQIGKFMDVISFNRYNGWYAETGSLLHITQRVMNESTQWHLKYNKPVLMSEYGADTIAGMHTKPEFVFSEDYQVALMSEHFKAFDKLRQEGFFMGEFIWNFADFATRQGITRVEGNKKGIFTRARQPKASAHHLRARYLALAAADAGAQPPPPEYYVADHAPAYHEEL
ncbi:beta-glucuronidase isoform X2 [Ostrinia nubilalis]|uniref:beta-glucuronidase isoform X2 n=1 Tax=Ostrinia nubilalis TaxID=29057 RepID=UPI003082305D